MTCCKSCDDDGPCRDAYRFAVVQEAGKDMVVWGPVSVESVSQDDKLIRVAAIEAALPHFWKRGALTMLHKDALIVGKVEELITDVSAGDVPEKARSLVEELRGAYGGLPTGVLTVTEGMVQAFPHLASVKGTRQFFCAARIYNDGDQASQAAMQEIRKGDLDSFSLAGMPIEAEEVEHCENGACRTVLDVSKMTLSAITLGSRNGGSGPFSAKTRNNGAALIAVTQARDGAVSVELLEGNKGQGQDDTVLSDKKNHGVGETMPTTVAQSKNDEAPGEEAGKKPVEEQDEPEGVDMEAVASAVQDLARRVEALEERLPEEPAEEEEEEEEADEEEDEEEPTEEAEKGKKPAAASKESVAQAVKAAVEQATKPLTKRLKALEAHKVFEQADTPPPATGGDPKEEANKLLEQAASTGDPYAVKEAIRKMRGDAV